MGSFEEASFVILTDSILSPDSCVKPKSEPQGPAISSESSRLERLYDYLSSKTDFDLPLCAECIELVCNGLETLYEDACAERDAYIELLNRIEDEPSPGQQDHKELELQIQRLKKTREKLLRDLRNAEADKDQAEEELKKARNEALYQQHEEQKLYKERNLEEMKVHDLKAATGRLDALTDYRKFQITRLEQTNVYNDVFRISHNGCFGTINGLRLQCLLDKTEDWRETNAAWGQTLFLLATLMSRLGCQLPEYRLRPLGSVSRVEKIELDPVTNEPTGRFTSFDLFSSGNYSFEKFMNYKRLDAAMVAFLDVLKQVGQFVEKTNPNLRLPYSIEGDRIGGCSIRPSFNSSDDGWTAACKYILTNLKWIMEYVVSR